MVSAIFVEPAIWYQFWSKKDQGLCHAYPGFEKYCTKRSFTYFSMIVQLDQHVCSGAGFFQVLFMIKVVIIPMALSVMLWVLWVIPMPGWAQCFLRKIVTELSPYMSLDVMLAGQYLGAQNLGGIASGVILAATGQNDDGDVLRVLVGTDRGWTIGVWSVCVYWLSLIYITGRWPKKYKSHVVLPRSMSIEEMSRDEPSLKWAHEQDSVTTNNLL